MLLWFWCSPTHPLAPEAFSLAFASYNEETLSYTMWQHVQYNTPEARLPSGDFVYSDDEDVQAIQEKGATLKSSPDYKTFASQVKVIGIWDDHVTESKRISKKTPIGASCSTFSMSRWTVNAVNSPGCILVENRINRSK